MENFVDKYRSLNILSDFYDVFYDEIDTMTADELARAISDFIRDNELVPEDVMDDYIKDVKNRLFRRLDNAKKDRHWYENETYLDMVLREKKDHLIKKLNISDDQKDHLIDFFNSHSNLESQINWNNKNLTYDDFQKVFDIASNSKGTIKKEGLNAFIEGKDYVDVTEYFFNGDKGIALIPKNYNFERWFQSKNNLGPEGSWCIGYQKSDEYWREYASKGHIFVGIANGDAKLMIDLSSNKFFDYDEYIELGDKYIGQSFDPITIFDSDDHEYFIKKIFKGTRQLKKEEEQNLFNSLKIKNYEDFLETAKQLSKNNFKEKRESILESLYQAVITDQTISYDYLKEYYKTFNVYQEEVDHKFYEILKHIKDGFYLFRFADFRKMYVDWNKVNFNNLNNGALLFAGVRHLPTDLNDLKFNEKENFNIRGLFSTSKGTSVDISKWDINTPYEGILSDLEVNLIVSKEQKNKIMSTNKYSDEKFEKLLVKEDLKENTSIFNDIFQKSLN